MSGVKLSGRIKSFDKYSVILESNAQEQLIFKHAISTVVVSKPFHAPHSNAATAGTHGVPGAPPGPQAVPGPPLDSDNCFSPKPRKSRGWTDCATPAAVPGRSTLPPIPI